MKTPKGPLAGKSVLVTRPKEQADSLLSQIKEQGGIPLSFPVVKITGVDPDFSKHHLSRYRWIVFTSKNGVDHFFRILNDREWSFEHHKIAAVGEKTARALKEWGIQSVLVPERYDAVALVECLKKEISVGEKVLFPKGSLAPSYIKDGLKDIAEVEEMVVYETKAAEDLDWSLVLKADCFFFLSPSAVSFMIAYFEKKNKSRILETPAFCIGPTTKQAALEKGFHHVSMPERYTAEDMVKLAAHYYQGGS
ncbi:uroporphyrinogen-III synthase [Fictibacillus phosphorivorans]|uniref:uroporphyrinogen-III synthase n=1 Tax=Fictibacillus phosphorivorans TaxID=1221500 RepID=UPI0020423597|nr:uroporphyrinogen-III synthase [Fictibacillus phosphorivorans]MCM3717026.1 uroporphyrinogen-III synthase [Fictibacillus phosphorivorans]MCM3774425.1 uroporphyrinogen-III synthase [Fictibacillus phosphorivorans]